MNSPPKGFPSYGVTAVVKFGGSLMRDLAACKRAIRELEELSRRGHQILVVPGGGIPDKAIEAVNETHPFSAFTAHHACALAQDQTGFMLADPIFSKNLAACASLGECRALLGQRKIPVLLPSRLLFALDPVEWSWQITSDAVASWVAWLTNCPRVAIWTDVDGVYRGGKLDDPSALISVISAPELARLGHTSIDACAADFIAQRGLSGVVLNGAYPERLGDWLEGREVVGTLIERSSAPQEVPSRAAIGTR